MTRKTIVGMDISQLAHFGGVAAYTQNLATKLSEISDLEMVYFYSSLRQTYKGSLQNVKSFKLPPSIFEILFNRLRGIPIERFIGPVDIFHSSDWTQPPSKAKRVTTYHDLVPIKYPEWSHPKIVAVQKRRLKIIEREIDLVIAVSKATKKDLIETSTIPPEKIVVIYEGVENYFKPQPEDKINEFKKKFGLPEEFVLAVGGIGKRRNLERVKEASKNYRLIVMGKDFPWLLREQLPLLYSSANVLLYPSLYEGFGLPVLEAMACGIPVITSAVSSMPEVGGEAVEYVNPQSVADIENRLRTVMEDNKRREDMIKKGLARAKKFTWERCAKETAEVYQSINLSD